MSKPLIVTIKLFAPAGTTPRFVGVLQVQETTAQPALVDTADLKLLWDVERTINHHIAGRCHIEVTE